MPKATITSKGQITIPKKIRDKLNLQPGDELDFEVESTSEIKVRTVKRNPDESFGILYRQNEDVHSVEEMESGVADYFKQKYTTDS